MPFQRMRGSSARPATTRRLRILTLEDRLAPAQLAGAHGAGCGCGLCAFRAPPADPAEIQRIYTEGTSQDYMAKHPDALAAPGEESNRFQAVAKWSFTATNGTVSTREPVVLTWGILPDGQAIASTGGGESSDPSSLRAFMDGLYGAGPGGSDLTLRPWFPLFQNSLNRLGAVSGITYVYQAADDGAAFPGTGGVLGARPDVRIGGHRIDAASGILAYNYFPNGGDMVIDTADGAIYGNTSGGSLRLRNILMHEQGHGVGLAHEGPISNTTLMEAFLSTAFDGPQFDDVLGLHRLYGDQFEKGTANATTGTATAIGDLTIGGTITRGASGDTASELTGATATDFVSIDDDGDTDFYSFTVAPNALFTAVLTPVGPTYSSGPQSGPFTTFTSSQQSDLTLAVLDSGGAVIATVNAGGLGAAETIANIYSGTSGGTFYVRATGANNAAQMYRLQLTATAAGGNVLVAAGDLQAIGTAVNNAMTITLSGANYRVTDPAGAIAGAGAIQVNATTVDVPVASVAGIIDVRGNDGNDSIAIDLAGGGIAPPGGLVITGGNGTDTVVGPNDAGTWTLTSAGGGSLTAAGITPLTFTGMESLTGGSQADGFTFAGGSLTGTITGGDGLDTVTADGGGRAFTITGANAGTVTVGTTATLASVENLVGGAGADSVTFSSLGSLSGTIDGGAGNDTLGAPAIGFTVTLSGPNAGSVASLTPGFVSMETVAGGIGPDTLIVQAAGALTGPFDGLGGTDTVNLSALGPHALTIGGLGATDGFTLSGVPAVAGGLFNVNAVVGSSAADTLTGPDVSSTWTVSAANGGSYSDDLTTRTLAFSAIESLAGGTASDQFRFNTGGSLTGTIDGGTGADLLTGDNAARTFTVTGVDAGTVSTILPGGFAGVENLAGGSAGDTFAFPAGGSLTGTVNGAAGTDQLVGPDSGRTYTLTATNTGTVSTLLPAGFTAVEVLTAGAGDDVLIGDNGPRQYTVTGLGAGTVSSILPGGFAGFESLQGGSGNDRFGFTGAGALTGTVNGGAGFDTVAGNDAGLEFTVAGPDAGTVAAVLPAGFAAVEHLTGGAGADTFRFVGGSLTGAVVGGTGSDVLIGDDTARTYAVNAANAGTVGGILPAGFSGVENFQGGSAADTFAFAAAGSLGGTIDGGDGTDALSGTNAGLTFTLAGPNAGTVSIVLAAGFATVENLLGGTGADTIVVQPAGTLAGNFDGGAGSDTVNLSALGAQAVAVTGLGAIDGFDLAVAPVAGGVRNVDVLVGSGAADTLTGRDVPATWAVGTTDAGSHADAGSGRSLTFSAIENLVGGAAADLFRFPGGSLTGSVSGGAGSDTVFGGDLARTYTVTGANAGNIGTILPGGFSAIENLQGGTGPDQFLFRGGSLAGTVTGGAGSDALSGDNAARTFTLTGADAGVAGGLAAFTQVENLRGGAGADTLVALPGGLSTGGFDGTDGLDTADLTARPEAQVVTLQAAGRTGYALQLGTVGPARGLDRVTAGGGITDRLTGLNAAAAWQVRAGADPTIYRQTATGYLLRLTGFDQLHGGAATDAFGVDFSTGVPVGLTGVSLDSAGGADSLTVTGTAGADVVSVGGVVVAVNGRVVRHGGFERLTVNAGYGNDHLTVGLGLPTGLTLVELFGGAGNDIAQVAPSPTARIKFDGGLGMDRLRVDVSQSGMPLYVPPPGVTTGTYHFGSRMPIDFVAVELREFGPLQ